MPPLSASPTTVLPPTPQVSKRHRAARKKGNGKERAEEEDEEDENEMRE